jgi:hypothetical protein
VERFDGGAAFGTIRSLRTAISMALPEFDGVRIGEHPLVSEVLRGMQQQRPAMPRYSTTWDTDRVVAWLAGLGRNSLLDELALRRKTLALVAITTIARSSDLARMRFSTLVFGPTRASVQCKPLKNSGALMRDVPIDRAANVLICPVAALEEYVARTRHRARADDEIWLTVPDRLLQHHALSPKTIASDLKAVLAAAGVDTDVFKAHSIRAAAASKAIDQGASVDDVMKRGRWSSKEVFTRFYDRSRMTDNFTARLFSSLPDARSVSDGAASSEDSASDSSGFDDSDFDVEVWSAFATAVEHDDDVDYLSS